MTEIESKIWHCFVDYNINLANSIIFCNENEIRLSFKIIGLRFISPLMMATFCEHGLNIFYDINENKFITNLRNGKLEN